MPDTNNRTTPEHASRADVEARALDRQSRSASTGAAAHLAALPAPERIPRPALLHYAALLSGFGTAFLGPSLPTLAATLHLSDRGAGAMFAAQFTGAFLGGWSTRAPLRRCMLRGYTCAAIGFTALAVVLAMQAALGFAIAALLLLGFGVGQIITSNNLLASELWSHRRGAALTLLNFTWSAGALCSPLFLPALLRAHTPAFVFGIFAALLAAGFLAVVTTAPAQANVSGSADLTALSAEESEPARRATVSAGLSQRTFLYFCLQLFLYGGVETSLDGWLHTYDLRYTHTTHLFAASTAAFWFCLTGTRAIVSALLLRLPDRQVLRAGLALAIGTLATLLAIGHGSILPLLAGLTGAALAPWFPLLFSGLVGEGPTATQAGRIVAVSGLGAAAIPWLVGRVSASNGSLRTALLLPIAGILALLLLSFWRPPAQVAP